ncbi:MAG: DUF4198 domain-containing protein [Marinovum sp.]|nr:DUF4198 domain-containing protein [Marinovum sp.]
MKHIAKTLLGGATALWLGTFAQAHEFWIEPETYQVAQGDKIIAALRVGENFAGSEYSFNPRNFVRFDVQTANGLEALPGRAGDRPAVQFDASKAGLTTIVHVTTEQRLTYNQFEKFEAFLAHKDWEDLMEVHRDRALPEEGFRERYSRYAKSLVAVGDGAGADQNYGLLTEIVALANPYTETLSEMPIQVFYSGSVRANAQVELFEKAPDGAVAVTLHRTDDEGIARFPVTAGHSYLVDAVVIRAMDPKEERDPVWESLWAALTFAIP